LLIYHAARPIFIGGMFKSGTTLLRAMLGRHSNLYSGLETYWFSVNWDDMFSKNNWLARMAKFFDIPNHEIQEIAIRSNSTEIFLDNFMSAQSRKQGKKRWIEKTPGNVGVIDRILCNWSDAVVLHVVRDPRDVYASMIEINKWTEPIEFADRWCATVGIARNWLRDQGGSHSAYFELRYEELVTRPRSVMVRILSFLGEPWEPGIDEFKGQNNEYELVKKVTGKESSTLRRLSQPLTCSRVGVWRKVLSPNLWYAVRDELHNRGYGFLVDELIHESERHEIYR